MPAAITVVGSLNMDFVVSVERLPSPGETVLGREFQMLPGGKGANQACAAGRLGTSAVITRMIGRVGYDVFGDHLKASLSAAGVDVSFVHATRSQPTGVALSGWIARVKIPSSWHPARTMRCSHRKLRRCGPYFGARGLLFFSSNPRWQRWRRL